MTHLDNLIKKLEELAIETGRQSICCSSYSCKEKALKYLDWYGEHIPVLLNIIKEQQDVIDFYASANYYERVNFNVLKREHIKGTANQLISTDRGKTARTTVEKIQKIAEEALK